MLCCNKIAFLFIFVAFYVYFDYNVFIPKAIIWGCPSATGRMFCVNMTS